MEARQQQQQRFSVAPAPAVSSVVLGNEDLLRLILIRLDGPDDLLHAALVSKRWLAAASDPAFLRDFRARCPPHLVGFLAVFGREPRGDEAVMLSSSSSSNAASNEEEEQAMVVADNNDDDDDVSRFVRLPRLPTFAGDAARLVEAAFNDDSPAPDLARDCRNGRVLVIPGGRRGAYAVHRPLRRTPGGEADVTQLPAPPLPVQPISEADRYEAHFVLVVEPAGSVDAVSCFDSSEMTYTPTAKGVIDVEIRVHVLQGDASWVTHASSGLQVQKPLEPYEFSYNLMVGNTHYVLAIVGYIGVFDMDSDSFSLVKLPDGVSCGEGGVLDHRLARAGDAGLYLVHVKGSELRILHHLQAMEDAGAVWEWELVDTIFLPAVFGDLLGGEPMGVQIFAVGDDAEFVFLTVGGSRGLFLLDVKTRDVENVLETSPKNDGGYLYRVFPFMMPWPPVFPALEEGRHAN